MPVFPKLKSGVVAQYPAKLESRYKTEVRRFLDSSEQRYRDFSGARRAWRIGLSRLDELELSTLRSFFATVRGSGTTFDFEDPWTGQIVGNCRFEDDAASFLSSGEFNSGATLSIVETL